MDENFSGVSTSTDAGSGTPSSVPADSSVSAPSGNSEPMSTAEFFAQHNAQSAQPANFAEAPAAENSADAPAEPENAEASATSDGLQIPETDDDLRALTDATAKQHIQGLRRHVRQNLEPKAKQFDAQIATFQQHGITPELIEPMAKMSGGLLATRQIPVQMEDGSVAMQEYMTTEPFWRELHGQSVDHLQQALYDAARMYPDFLLGQIPRESVFQALGLNPALAEVYSQVREDGTLNGVAPAFAVDQSVLSSLPEDLHATWREIATADPEFAEELKWQLTDGAQPRIAERILRGEKFQREKDARDRAADERAAAEAESAREQEANHRVTEFYATQERAFMDDLRRTYNPYGTGEDAKADNEWIQDRISTAVREGLAADAKASQLIAGLNDALRRGNTLYVSQYRMQLEPFIAKLRNEEIKRYDSLFRRAIGNEQQQRAASANLKSVSGLGGFSAEREGNGLANADNLNDPANLRALAASLGVRMGQ